MATTKWVLDPSHSEVQFKVKHLMITNVTGSMGSFEGTAETENDTFENAKVVFRGQADSITTGSEQRDVHLKSDDFFGTDKHREIKFESTSITKKSEENYVMEGNLTIRDVTKPIKLDVEYHGIQKDPWGNMKAGFSVTGKINRGDWGLKWNAALETGGVLVSEEVKINCEVQFTKQS
jgi:polyisoprenoid-binding protein YceI